MQCVLSRGGMRRARSVWRRDSDVMRREVGSLPWGVADWRPRRAACVCMSRRDASLLDDDVERLNDGPVAW